MDSFDLDAYLSESTCEPFAITVSGKQVALPHYGTLTFSQLGLIDSGRVDVLLEQVAPDSADALLGLQNRGLREVLKQWRKQSESSEGESKASSDSSESTAGPSQPTSPSTTKPTSPKP